MTVGPLSFCSTSLGLNIQQGVPVSASSARSSLHVHVDGMFMCKCIYALSTEAMHNSSVAQAVISRIPNLTDVRFPHIL